MSTKLDLFQIERRAYRSVFQDGLKDVYYGLIIISMAAFLFRPAEGYSPANILLALGGYCLSYLLFWSGKKFITLPRMGQVRFGEARKKRRRTMITILSIIVVIQVGFVLYTGLVWLNSDGGNHLNNLLNDREMMDLVVASIGALIVGSGMTLVAYFQDFSRGYYIAVVMMLAVFLMIYLNQPIYPIILGALIILPGIVLFIRFIQKYPQPGTGRENG
jgi:hypothetical protein